MNKTNTTFADWIEAGTAASTRRAYKDDLARFWDWGTSHHHPETWPVATPQHLLAFNQCESETITLDAEALAHVHTMILNNVLTIAEQLDEFIYIVEARKIIDAR